MQRMKDYSTSELFLIAGLPDQKKAATYLGVNRTTIKRWRDGTTQTPKYITELLNVLGGNPPRTNPRQVWFDGWRFVDDFFISPEGDKYTEGDIRAIHGNLNLITMLEVDLRKTNETVTALRRQIAELESPPALPDNVIPFPRRDVG